jgi:hypothetical protein
MGVAYPQHDLADIECQCKVFSDVAHCSTSVDACSDVLLLVPVQMMLDGHVYLNVDAQHIQQSSPRLLTATLEVPDDMLNLWEVQLNK